MSRYDLQAIERRHRRADARFRGEDYPDDEEQLGIGDQVLGGALLGLLLLAILIAVGMVAAVSDSDAKRPRR